LADKTDRFQGELGQHYKQTLGEHEGYKYPHDYPGHWVGQRYLPEGVEGGWYRPSDQGFEATIRERLARLKTEDEDDYIPDTGE
jgi:putative ATPase